ncbi:MAG: hypothetical protein M3203_08685, partial [Actinomycetota bacterium]|nr:hypothetical protein [Actinomycetota bacterium]
ARAGATTQPMVAMAVALAVLGMLLFFGSQGLPDSGFRAFRTPAMFRPVMPGQPRLVPAGASSRLDAVALDALVGMASGQQPSADHGSGAPERRRPNRWWSSRPW